MEVDSSGWLLPLQEISPEHARMNNGWSSSESSSFHFDESDSASSSGASTHDTSDDTHGHSDDWRYSSKYWTSDDWATIADRYLYERGFALHTKADFTSKVSLEQDPDAFFAERALALDDRCQLYGLRLATNLCYPDTPSVYVRAILASPGSDEIKVTKLLKSIRDHPHNFAVRTLEVFELHHDGIDIAFLVQEDAGQPSDCFEDLFRDEKVWRKFILDCFEGLTLFHSLGIAHLDIGPTNVLYDPRTGRPSFIDWEGCHIHEGEIQKPHDIIAKPKPAAVPAVRVLQCCSHCHHLAPAIQRNEGGGGGGGALVVSRRKGAPTAANARLPELAEPEFDVFAADVWCLGAMLRDMRTFPDDDLRAHFRAMCMKEPRARPTMAYALEKLKALLASETDLLH